VKDPFKANLSSIIITAAVFLAGCSTLGGRDSIQREVELSDNTPRSERYLESLKKFSKVVYYYDEYQLRLGVQAVWLSGELKAEIKKEMEELYSGNYPPAADSALSDLLKEKNCETNILVQAWDEIYRENPLERKPRSLEVTKNAKIPYSIRRLNDLGGIETEFFPFKSFWGQWHQICFSESISSSQGPEIDFNSPTGQVKVTWK
jgi:hypothetical protein